MPWLSHADYTQLFDDREELIKEREDLIRENEKAKAQIAELEQLRANLAVTQKALDQERERNRKREERLIERYQDREERLIDRHREVEERLLDRVLVSKGAYAITPSVERERRKGERPSPSAIPLTAIEEAELKMYIESGAEHDPPFGPNVMRRMFERDRRKKLDPHADLSEYDDLPIIQPPDEIMEESEA